MVGRHEPPIDVHQSVNRILYPWVKTKPQVVHVSIYQDSVFWAYPRTYLLSTCWEGSLCLRIAEIFQAAHGVPFRIERPGCNHVLPKDIGLDPVVQFCSSPNPQRVMSIPWANWKMRTLQPCPLFQQVQRSSSETRTLNCLGRPFWW